MTVDPPAVISRVDGSIGVVTLNRPHKRNALDPTVEALLEEVVRDVASKDDVRAILLIGADGTFCAGADLAMLGGGSGRKNYDPASHLRFDYLLQLPHPVCAAVQGPCFGSGLALALHCDLRIAAPSSRFRAQFGDLGLVGEMGVPWLLAHTAGASRAMEWLVSRRVIGAAEAGSTGLANVVLDEDGFERRSIEQVERWVEGASAYSLAMLKRQVWSASDVSLQQAEYQSGHDTRTARLRSEYRERVEALRQRLR